MNLTQQPWEDPYARISLISHTRLDFTDRFTEDQLPVLAARVSHSDDDKTGLDPDADERLTKYLAKHAHWSVFEHQYATFQIVAPLFVIREMQRHRSFSFNEVSMRYSSDPIGEFYIPKSFRKQETRNKQGSAGELSEDAQEKAYEIIHRAYTTALETYRKLIDLGVCREQARIVVPVGNYSKMYMTGNIRSWVHFCNLRVAEDAQWEIRQYAKIIDQMLLEVYPKTWKEVRKFFSDKIA